jgi:hypothetical protein
VIGIDPHTSDQGARLTNAPMPGIRDRATRSSFSRTAESGLASAPMRFAASTPAFDRALSVEIAASEQMRMRVLAGTLAILLLGDQLLFLFARETLEQFTGRLLPTWRGHSACSTAAKGGAGQSRTRRCTLTGSAL